MLTTSNAHKIKCCVESDELRLWLNVEMGVRDWRLVMGCGYGGQNCELGVGDL